MTLLVRPGRPPADVWIPENELERLREVWRQRDERYQLPLTAAAVENVRLARLQDAERLPERFRAIARREAATWTPPAATPAWRT